MNKDLPVFDTRDCMDLVKKMYPYIPIWVIRRVLYATDIYQYKVGIIHFKPSLDFWHYSPKRKRKH